MKKLTLCFFVFALALAAAARDAHAAFVITLQQIGTSVVVNGSGTINTTALSFVANGSLPAKIYPAFAQLYVGPAGTTNNSYYNGGGLTGPIAFGSGNNVFASSGTGDFVGIVGSSPLLYVPQGYISGTPLADTATFSSATFASLGFGEPSFIG